MASIETMFIGIIIAFVLVLLIFIIGGFLWSAGKEGRFMMGRFFRRGGIDLLSYERLSRQLKLDKIKWDGKYWVQGKEATMIGIEPAKGTKTTDQQYNDAVSATARWEGNKRPVLMATQEMFFTWSTGFLDMITKATRFERFMELFTGNPEQKKLAEEAYKKEYETLITEIKDIKETVEKEETGKWNTAKPLITDLLTQVQMGYNGIKMLSIVTADEINKYLEGATPRVLMESREQGKNEGILLMKEDEKKEGLPPMVKALAISASVIMALVIAYVVITGKNPVAGIKDVLPN